MSATIIGESSTNHKRKVIIQKRMDRKTLRCGMWTEFSGSIQHRRVETESRLKYSAKHTIQRTYDHFISKRSTQQKLGSCQARSRIVLGGPGVGKGAQCTRIAETFGFTHLSVGDLLRKKISSNTEYGAMILETKREKFLVDGLPRSEENSVAYEQIIFITPETVKRILHHNQMKASSNSLLQRSETKALCASRNSRIII
ncbi:hypothetical protein QVD17_35719 [Tagetes erecta]|uniref:adenylate kinase n=1 Tax=Tagetes erecta TaxID=13708 RepID=A0AAD8JR26_TARER|nr:hypothetical protein QVD17_35719 [Tagetes erecta]